MDPFFFLRSFSPSVEDVVRATMVRSMCVVKGERDLLLLFRAGLLRFPHTLKHASTSWNPPQNQFASTLLVFRVMPALKYVFQNVESSFSFNIIVNTNKRHVFPIRRYWKSDCRSYLRTIDSTFYYLSNIIRPRIEKRNTVNTETLIWRVLATGKSYEDLNIVLQFILNNSWSVYCHLKIQDSYLRIRIKRRIFKDKIPNMTGWIWSTSVSQVLHTVSLNVLYYVS